MADQVNPLAEKIAKHLTAEIRGRHTTTEELAALIAALLPEGDGWIPCAERLPEVGELVDVVANDIAQKLPAFLSGKGFANEDGFEWQWADEECDPAPLEVITHWRKRPTFTPGPPAEGQPAAKDTKTQEKKP